jgi:hypothetical protein
MKKSSVVRLALLAGHAIDAALPIRLFGNLPFQSKANL